MKNKYKTQATYRKPLGTINNTKTQIFKTENDINPNVYFTNIATDLGKTLPPSNLNSTKLNDVFNSSNSMFLAPVDKNEVSAVINNMSNKLIKLLREGLIEPFTIIINKCFEFGQFLDRLKL